jgi:hypothetical protein
MMRVPPWAALAAVLCAAVLAACGGGSGGHEESAQQHRAATTVNPSNFPLYPKSSVVQVVPVDSTHMFAAIRAADPNATVPRNFRGHEIIAETNATMPQLEAWIRSLKASPPRGLHKAKSGSSTMVSGSEADAQFESANGERSVYLIAAYPRRIREQLGPAWALIDSYTAVPAMLRGPIDEQAKKQMGYTVTEMLDPKSPVGAAIATLKRLQDKDRRAILIIDESKPT